MSLEREIPAGRPIVLTPVKPGIWLMIWGVVIGSLGPLFGFLIGSMIGIQTEVAGMNPIFLFLFLGLLVGGFGLILLLLGVRRLWLHLHREAAAEES